MRTEKDEIARLKAEVIGLQKIAFAAQSSQKDGGKKDTEKHHAGSENLELERELIELKKSMEELLKKLECINTLKARNLELEEQNLILIERVKKSEAGFNW